MNRASASLLLVFLLCLMPLALGMERLLTATLPGGLPLGTLLAALALALGALVPATADAGSRLLRAAGWVALAAGLPWLPLGIYLSGDARLNFGADSSGSQAYWSYTGALAALVLLLVNLALLAALWRAWRRA